MYELSPVNVYRLRLLFISVQTGAEHCSCETVLQTPEHDLQLCPIHRHGQN